MSEERRPEGGIFELDRVIESDTQAILWLAALRCSQVKYDSVGLSVQLLEKNIERESDGKTVRELRIKDRVRKTSDLLYEVRFSVPVADLYIWFQSTTDTTSIAVVDFRGTDQLIKKVTFKEPIPLINGYVTLSVSYRYSETEFPDNFAVDTTFFEQSKGLHPCYTLGILNDRERDELIRAYVKSSESGANLYVPFSIEPSIHLKDGTVKPLGTVNVDVASLIKQAF